MHKDLIWNLCNLPVCRKTARVGRARAARKTEKTPTLRSRSLIRKEVNISEMLVRGVGLEPTQTHSVLCQSTWTYPRIFNWLCNRHNPTFLQPWGSGSHLYTANRYTLRWDVFVGQVLLALVGVPSSGCLSSSLCTYYSTLLVVCQEVFEKNSQLFFGGICDYSPIQSFTTVYRLLSDFLFILTPLKSSEWTSYCSAYQFLKPILSASSWHTYYSTLWEVCQEFFETFFQVFFKPFRHFTNKCIYSFYRQRKNRKNLFTQCIYNHWKFIQ